MQAAKQYDARLDSKRRVTIRGAMFDYYHVIEYDDGKVVLEPRVLTPPITEAKLREQNSGTGEVAPGTEAP